MGGMVSTLKQGRHKQPAASAVDEHWRCQEKTQLDAKDGSDWMALYRAMEVGDESEALRLLAAGVPVHVADDTGRTPLMVAASKGSKELCELLANAGVDVGARDVYGQTALHVAAVAEGGVAVVKLLLRRGADPHIQDSYGRSALHCALQACTLAAAEVLVPAVGPLLQRDDTGRTELHWAAANGTPQLVRQLIAVASGGSVERDGLGMTPLARALRSRSRETAGVLVAEACPSAASAEADAFGRTVLHWAAFAGYPEVVHQLLERGFSPLVKDTCSRDALIWAVESGERQVVEEILRTRGYRECVDKYGQTALHVAAIRGDVAVIALLLDHKADSRREDLRGMTPLMYALRGGHRDAAFLLMMSGEASMKKLGGGRTLLHWAAVGGDADSVRKLLADGAAVNAVDAQRKTAAALAVEYGNQKAAEVLVAAEGFRVMRDREGRTPLHRAAAAGWWELSMQLLSLGANPNEEANDYMTPVMEAMRAGHYSLTQTIVRAWRQQQQLLSNS